MYHHTHGSSTSSNCIDSIGGHDNTGNNKYDRSSSRSSSSSSSSSSRSSSSSGNSSSSSSRNSPNNRTRRHDQHHGANTQLLQRKQQPKRLWKKKKKKQITVPAFIKNMRIRTFTCAIIRVTEVRSPSAAGARSENRALRASTAVPPLPKRR